MKKLQLFIAMALCCLFWMDAQAQQVVQQKAEAEIGVSVTHAKLLGKTPPIRDLQNAPITDPDKKARDRKFRGKTIPNFNGRETPAQHVPGALPIGADPVRQMSFNHSSSIPVEPIG